MATATKPLVDCGNCGIKIGALEHRHDWQGHQVCGSCYAKLSNPAGGAALVAPVVHVVATGQVVCPFCKKVITPKTEAKGSMAVAVVLLLFFVIPGLIYMITSSGYVKNCPECHTKIADA